MIKIKENENGLIGIIVAIIVLLVVLVVLGSMFMDALLMIGIFFGLILIMYAVARYVPMPHKLYGIIVCLVLMLLTYVWFTYF